MSKQFFAAVCAAALSAVGSAAFAQDVPLAADIQEKSVSVPAAEPSAVMPVDGVPAPAQPVTDEAVPADIAGVQPAAAPEGEGFMPVREDFGSADKDAAEAPKVMYNPSNRRDPTLSPDEFLLLQYREQQRFAALEAERQKKLAEERRKRLEEERRRQLELELIKDPTRAVRNKIHVGGIIGQEVFIGSKVYTPGNSIYGAKIVEVHPEEVVFSYKGHKFIRKVNLK